MTFETVGSAARVSGGESSRSAVAWSAIIAGALVAVAVSVVLLVLGSAYGLASMSPWSGAGASAASFGVGAAIWLIVTEWLASGIGGYLAGRLRTKWVGVHDHEVFFRDTAHGFITWAVATVLVSTLLASTLASIVGVGTQAVSSVASGAAQVAAGAAQGAAGNASPQLLDPTSYFVDRLFRADSGTGQAAGAAAAPAAGATTAPASPADTTAAPSASGAAPAPSASGMRAASAKLEGARIFALSLANGQMDPNDRTYLAGLVAQNTGLTQADAAKRIDDVVSQAQAAETKVKQAADAARQAAAKFSLFFCLSLIVGAFIASVAAAYGGRERDENETLLLTSTGVLRP